jgi:hypothetical protein
VTALKNIEHLRIGGGWSLFCLWPRHGGAWAWGGELLVVYTESPCGYRHPQEVTLDQEGVWKRGYLRLRRSTDGGLRWEDAGKLVDHSLPIEKQRQLLRLDEYRLHVGPERETVEMGSANAVQVMSRLWCGDEVKSGHKRGPVTCCLRSADRGHTWEAVPSVLWPGPYATVVEMGNNWLHLGERRMLCWVAGGHAAEGGETEGLHVPLLYRSDDDGGTWEMSGHVCRDPWGREAYSYPQIVALPSGRWVCVVGAWDVQAGARSGWASVCFSDDGGLNWSRPRKIVTWSHAPFLLRLRDGRLLVLYGRRAPDPAGLYAVWSEDEGQRWSEPARLRNGGLAAGPRGVAPGVYPVGVELADGRVLAVYCWQQDDADVPWYGGRSLIEGTFFRLA